MARRRGNGEGSISLRSDGRYMARATLQTPTGPKPKAFYGRTRKEASAKMLSALAASNSGKLVFDDSVTLGAFLATWLEGTRTTLKASSHESYARAIKNHIAPALGGVRLSKLSAPRIQGYYAQKLADGLAPASVRIHYAVLHRALRQAQLWHMVTENVASLVTPPKAGRKQMHPLDPDEVRVFLDTARAAEGRNRYAAVYPLAIGTGLRIGEAAALRWSDLDLDRGMLHVSRTLSSASSGPRFTSPKSGKSRTVSLPDFAVAALRRHRTRQAEQRLALGLGQPLPDSCLIFPGRDGVSAYNPDTLTRHNFRPLLERAGLGEPRRSFHDLRHTCATLLLSRGVHPKFLQELLGHATIAMTLDTYSHVLPSMGDATARAMDAALG